MARAMFVVCLLLLFVAVMTGIQPAPTLVATWFVLFGGSAIAIVRGWFRRRDQADISEQLRRRYGVTKPE